MLTKLIKSLTKESLNHTPLTYKILSTRIMIYKICLLIIIQLKNSLQIKKFIKTGTLCLNLEGRMLKNIEIKTTCITTKTNQD